MCFENYASRIVSLANFDFFQKPLAEYKEVARLTVDKGEMKRKRHYKQNFLNLTTRGFNFHIE